MKGLLAPQNTFLDTIATRFDGTRRAASRDRGGGWAEGDGDVKILGGNWKMPLGDRCHRASRAPTVLFISLLQNFSPCSGMGSWICSRCPTCVALSGWGWGCLVPAAPTSSAEWRQGRSVMDEIPSMGIFVELPGDGWCGAGGLAPSVLLSP